MIHDYGIMYKNMATAYGFTPDQVSNMTFAQIEAYLAEKKTLSAGQVQNMLG